jgi:hypothetical protein
MVCRFTSASLISSDWPTAQDAFRDRDVALGA